MRAHQKKKIGADSESEMALTPKQEILDTTIPYGQSVKDDQLKKHPDMEAISIVDCSGSIGAFILVPKNLMNQTPNPEVMKKLETAIQTQEGMQVVKEINITPVGAPFTIPCLQNTGSVIDVSVLESPLKREIFEKASVTPTTTESLSEIFKSNSDSADVPSLLDQQAFSPPSASKPSFESNSPGNKSVEVVQTQTLELELMPTSHIDMGLESNDIQSPEEQQRKDGSETDYSSDCILESVDEWELEHPETLTNHVSDESSDSGDEVQSVSSNYELVEEIVLSSDGDQVYTVGNFYGNEYAAAGGKDKHKGDGGCQDAKQQNNGQDKSSENPGGSDGKCTVKSNSQNSSCSLTTASSSKRVSTDGAGDDEDDQNEKNQRKNVKLDVPVEEVGVKEEKTDEENDELESPMKVKEEGEDLLNSSKEKSSTKLSSKKSKNVRTKTPRKKNLCSKYNVKSVEQMILDDTPERDEDIQDGKI